MTNKIKENIIIFWGGDWQSVYILQTPLNGLI